MVGIHIRCSRVCQNVNFTLGLFILLAVGIVVIPFIAPVAIDKVADQVDDVSDSDHLNGDVMVKHTMVVLKSMSLTQWVLLTL